MGLFEFFKRKSPPVTYTVSGMPPLFFKDGTAAIEYACKFMECPLQEGSFLPARVLDPREMFGAATAIQTQKDGNQVAMLRIASSDGGFIVFAATAGPKGPQLKPGDFVAWRAAKHSADVAASMDAKDKRSGWVGLIVGTLKPEHRDGSWVGDARFAP
jgi:hypothetical protein